MRFSEDRGGIWAGRGSLGDMCLEMTVRPMGLVKFS